MDTEFSLNVHSDFVFYGWSWVLLTNQRFCSNIIKVHTYSNCFCAGNLILGYLFSNNL